MTRHSKRVAANLHVFLGDAERLARRDPKLLLDQIDAGHQLGDTVLDLDAAVDFHEVEVPFGVEQELHRAGVAVADVARALGRKLTEALPRCRIQTRRGRLLDDLLAPPLEGAVALPEGQRGAVLIGHQLDLDVVGALDASLQVEGAVAEEALGFHLGDRELARSSSRSSLAGRMPRPPPPATALIIKG